MLAHGTHITASGTWTIGKASTASDSRTDARVLAAQVQLPGDASSVANLSTVTVGEASSKSSRTSSSTGTLSFSGQDFLCTKLQTALAGGSSHGDAEVIGAWVTLDAARTEIGSIDLALASSYGQGASGVAAGNISLSGGTLALGDLNVSGVSADSSNSEATGWLNFTGRTWQATGEWNIGQARKYGIGGSAIVHQADVELRGGRDSTAQLRGIHLGGALATYGSATASGRLVLQGGRIDTELLEVGFATPGSAGSAVVEAPLLDLDADLYVSGSAGVGIGTAGGSYASKPTVSQAGILLRAGARMETGADLTIGSATAPVEYAQATVSSPSLLAPEGAALRVGGHLILAQAIGSAGASANRPGRPAEH